MPLSEVRGAHKQRVARATLRASSFGHLPGLSGFACGSLLTAPGSFAPGSFTGSFHFRLYFYNSISIGQMPSTGHCFILLYALLRCPRGPVGESRGNFGLRAFDDNSLQTNIYINTLASLSICLCIENISLIYTYLLFHPLRQQILALYIFFACVFPTACRCLSNCQTFFNLFHTQTVYLTCVRQFDV